MTVKKNHKRPVLLSHGRPPTVNAKSKRLSSTATRNLIRSHHRLLKAREKAVNDCDDDLVKSIEARIKENGGLESYQLASKAGQSLERGGDSSRVLVDWMSPTLSQLKRSSFKLRVLEVGALSTQNACSRNRIMDVTKIDLHSRESGILQQDFMERPIPTTDDERFHLISLSLVLNYVPTAAGRGDMLKRCGAFLTKTLPPGCPLSNFTPCLFLVLPTACINNSRYLTEKQLQEIMASIGFNLLKSKETSKLIYQLWEFNNHGQNNHKRYSKALLNPGAARNNFAVVIND
jgi:25S rRNA (adenine2142-N1)-methyltransferase